MRPNDSRDASPETRPLQGLRVVVTRPEPRGLVLAQKLQALGAEAPLLPLISIHPAADPVPLDAAVTALRTPGSFQALAVTSAAALPELSRRWGSHPAPAGLLIGAVGTATANALRAAGWPVHVLPSGGSGGAALGAALAQRLAPGARVLFPSAADARPELPQTLREAGLSVHQVVAYTKDLPPEAPLLSQAIFGEGPLGWVTFTSPRIVHHLTRVIRQLSGPPWLTRRTTLRAASIGATTSAALRELGIQTIAEAQSPSDEGLIRVIRSAVRP